MLKNLWKVYLDEVLRRKFDETQISRRRPTFGLEHEFFILNDSGDLCSGEESQRIFSKISKMSGTRVVHDVGTNKILQINFEHGESGSYSALKYEFYPHLLEIALGYSTRPDLLKSRFLEIYSLLERAVEGSGLRISGSSHFSLSELPTESFEALDEKRKKLHLGRRARLHSAGENVLKANFPAYTAGTQIQVGGIDWWNQEGVIGQLYLREQDAILSAFKSISSDPVSFSSLVCERFRRYRDVYSSKLLHGFPDFEFWTLTQWSQALSLDLGIDTPNDSGQISHMVANCHDLSLVAVKPRTATLEFRGSPSLPDCERIFLELDRRVSQFNESLATKENPHLVEARQKWQRFVTEEFADSHERKRVMNGE